MLCYISLQDASIQENKRKCGRKQRQPQKRSTAWDRILSRHRTCAPCARCLRACTDKQLCVRSQSLHRQTDCQPRTCWSPSRYGDILWCLWIILGNLQMTIVLWNINLFTKFNYHPSDFAKFEYHPSEFENLLPRFFGQKTMKNSSSYLSICWVELDRKFNWILTF